MTPTSQHTHGSDLRLPIYRPHPTETAEWQTTGVLAVLYAAAVAAWWSRRTLVPYPAGLAAWPVSASRSNTEPVSVRV
jgi:hypothetical protein